MSESSKMGLFGSKDESKDSKKESKDNSPDSYAPYCVDSDSETYDTEALSIMDINDIIGVQSEPVTESTLESEIAALSKIITDSKGELSQKEMDVSYQLQARNTTVNETFVLDDEVVQCSVKTGESSYRAESKFSNVSDLSTSRIQREAIDDGLLSSVCNKEIDDRKSLLQERGSVVTKGTIDVSTKLDEDSNSNRGSSIDGVNILAEYRLETASEDTRTDGQVAEDKSTDVITNVEDKQELMERETCSASVVGAANLDEVGDDQGTKECSAASIKESSDCDSVVADVFSNSEKAADTLTTVGSISKSLQLIGEAYTSEDSQEMETNEEFSSKVKSSVIPETAKYDVGVKSNFIVNVESRATVENISDFIKSCKSESDNCVVPAAMQDQEKNISEQCSNVDRTENCELYKNASKISRSLESRTDDDTVTEDSKDILSEKFKANEDIEKIDGELEKNDDLSQISELENDDIEGNVKMKEMEVVEENITTGSEENENKSKQEEECFEERLQSLDIKEDIEKLEMSTVSRTESSTETIVVENERLQSHNENKGDQHLVIDTDPKLNDELLQKSEDQNQESLDKVSTETIEAISSPESKNNAFEQESQCIEKIEANMTTVQESEDVSLEAYKNDENSCAIKSVPENTELQVSSQNLESISHTSDSKKENLSEIPNKIEFLPEIKQENMQPVKEVNLKEGEPSKLSSQSNTFQVTKEVLSDTLQNLDRSIQTRVKQQDTQNTQLLPCSMDVEPSLSLEQNITDDIEMYEDLENNDAEMSDVQNPMQLVSELNENKSVRNEGTEEKRETNDDSTKTFDNIINDQNVESNEKNEIESELSTMDRSNITSTTKLKKEDDSISSKSVSSFTKETSPINDSAKSNDNIDSEFVKHGDCIFKEESKLSNFTVIESSNREALLTAENSGIINVPHADPETFEVPRSKQIKLELEMKTVESKLDKQEIDKHLTKEESLVPKELKISEDTSKIIKQSDSQIAEKDKFIDEVAKVSDIMHKTKDVSQLLDNEEKGVSSVHFEGAQPSENVMCEERNTKDTWLTSQSENNTNKEFIDTEECIIKIQSEITDDNVKSISQEVDSAQRNTSQSDNSDTVHSDILQIIREERSSTVLELENVEAEEEAMEEEMNLTLDPDDADMQLEEMQNNVEKVLDEKNIENLEEEEEEEEMEDQVEINLSLDPEEKVDDLPTDIEESKDNLLISNTQYPAEVDVASSHDKVEASVDKEPEDSKDDLKNILNTEEGVVEIFTDDQSEGTQDIMAGIMDTVDNVAEILTNVQPQEMVEDLKNILETEESVQKEIEEVLSHSTDLPLVETEIEDLTEKLPHVSDDMLNKELEDPITEQNIDSLEGLLDLDLIPEGEESALKVAEPTAANVMKETEEGIRSIEKEMDVTLLLEDSSQTTGLSQDTDYITDVISSCLTNADSSMLGDSAANSNAVEIVIDKSVDDKAKELLEINENLVDESADKNRNNIDEQSQLESEGNDLDMAFELTETDEQNSLEAVAVLESESKIELSEHLLLESMDQSDTLNDATSGVEASEPNSEISELESAVKFLQESEEQAIDSPMVLSPKMVDSVVDDMPEETEAGLFVPEEDICEASSELVAEMQNISSDPIAISEAEIITEAAKLESERRIKLTEQGKSVVNTLNFTDASAKMSEVNTEILESNTAALTTLVEISKSQQELKDVMISNQKGMDDVPKLSENILTMSEPIPKMSILEERLKEPPKIEIPTLEMSKLCETPTVPKTSLLIQKDAKISTYQKMLESPKGAEKTELKFVETPRKDSEKHDFENVGSPRIILKIAKSAIADCGEPRSPKSPKIRSTTNSPNPEDSPGQKLGKIKLKLSKGGHPSIISNENVEEMGQWHTEGTSSLSPIGMKIKLSKSGDASIIQTEKYEVLEDSKESRHRFEEVKRIESPIGMKIKLSKSGDASIVQQDSREVVSKHKDKLDTVQEAPKRTESPIGMKIKLSRTGDASIIQPDKQDTLEDYKDGSSKHKEKLEIVQDTLKRTESPIGMKIKLSRTGDASIVPSDLSEEGKESMSKPKEKLETSQEAPKRTESPIGMKIKLSKTRGGASIIQPESFEDGKDKLEIPEVPKRTESPLGMKIKLSKTGDASIIHTEVSDEAKDVALKYKDRLEIVQDAAKQIESPIGVKIKVTKAREALIVPSEASEESDVTYETPKKSESSIGMKFKLSKTGDASIIHPEKQELLEEPKIKERVESFQEMSKRTESPIGMKIKLSRTGDASIIHQEISEEFRESTSKSMEHSELEHSKRIDSPLGVKIKLLKTGDASIVEPEKKEKSQRRKDIESPLEMKIRLSKTGHPTIVTCDNYGELMQRNKDVTENVHDLSQKHVESSSKEPALKILKTGHSTIVQSNRSELTIEPIQSQSRKLESGIELTPKRKEITISPIELKKSKLEAKLSHMLPEVTIQPVMLRNQKQMMFDPKTSAISRQQMNVISQEISITQVRPSKSIDLSMSEKLKDILSKNVPNSPSSSDCEIIEHRPELIIVNENSNSSQDIMIIEEVPSARMPEVKIPKKRGRPRRNPLPPHLIQPPPPHMLLPRDPLALDDGPQVVRIERRENERPKRTCRNQKSYAPPKRGRGRGRGKRKMMEKLDSPLSKMPRIDEDLTAIEQSTMSLIALDGTLMQQDGLKNSSELYKALKQPPMDRKGVNISRAEKQSMSGIRKELERKIDAFKGSLPSNRINAHLEAIVGAPRVQIQLEPIVVTPKIQIVNQQVPNAIRELLNSKNDKSSLQLVSDEMHKPEISTTDKQAINKMVEDAKSSAAADSKDVLMAPEHQNWLTPSSKKQPETSARSESISTVQVIDEETRMSAESGSRSQTPARNVSAPASETIVNEESQGSVLSTATTESEKVKVKNRRMEINFDPDEGPFTVDKIAEYEWPLDRKGETFMVQEQISQYLGVKSFKRKYPDLKRRVVDMEERNYLRENGLVSEAMCDMGLTAICSTEVLDVMCSDFPDQYEEYRKHMREKQVKEHSKKQKELTAAANAERNRIDLAEMAVQSALSWNVNLNKARKETRKCSLDLQTFTIHVPKKQQKVEAERKISHYPVALIPGQYTDYYREYTPAELRYYPLNTVLYGPMRPNERKFDSQSEGSQSDSDSDSSTDDSSSSSSEGTQDTEESQSTMDEVDMEMVHQKEESKHVKCKMCLKNLNKHSKNEILIQCGTCNGNVHPSCIDLTLDMVPHIQAYAWQCTDCKTCAQCHDPADEDKMLFCDMCDRGYHIYCVGLRRVPQGRWHCQECAICANCGSREPGGATSDRNSVAQWQHEYKKGEKNTRVYVSTLCVPCSKLWRKGRYCPHCSRCHSAPRLDLEANLVHCSACDKYLHLGCVETKGAVIDKKNYLCDFCTPNRQQIVRPLVSKT